MVVGFEKRRGPFARLEHGKHADKDGLLCDVNTASADKIHPYRENYLHICIGCLPEHNSPHVCTSVFSNEVHYPLFMCVESMYHFYWFAYTIRVFMKYIIRNYLCV